MRVLLVGSGGREAAMAWKIALSPHVNEVTVCPGNPGMPALSPKIKCQKVSRPDEYLALGPDLVVIGPEAPLSEGLTDELEARGLLVAAPSKAAARLEGSKAFCKEIFEAANIPSPAYAAVRTEAEAAAALKTWNREGVVVKVDGLAQGKGVIVCSSLDEARAAVKGFFDGSYLGCAVEKLLLEERIAGPEVSAFALCDGDDFVYLGSATDYKRLLDNDEGPNTGGMGTISPSPVLNASEELWIQDHIFAPTLRVMKERGTPFKGFLFAGLMKTESGLKALEFNTRLGDPETQSLLPRLEDDFALLLKACAERKLRMVRVAPTQTHAVHIVLAAEGYPGTRGQKIRKNDVLSVKQLGAGSILFPGGVSEEQGTLVTSGGRVCGLTVTGPSLAEARDRAYQEIKNIHFAGAQYRKDIGLRFL